MEVQSLNIKTYRSTAGIFVGQNSSEPFKKYEISFRFIPEINTRLFIIDFTQRPKHLLLFVNPFGGRKNAMKIYEKFGKPLFTIAGIEVTVNVSQRKDQIRDFVINHNLDMFDSVACVGGDGTLSELFNGMVLRQCKITGIDPDDISQELPKPTIPVGVIPGNNF